MTPDEVQGMMPAAQIVDVRTEREFDAGHVRGAVHIPLAELPARFDELDRDRAVIVTCQVGQRSGLAAQFLSSRGFEAHNLEGGLEEWMLGDFPLEGRGETSGPVAEGKAEHLEW